MATFNPSVPLSQSGYAFQALEILFAPAPSAVELDPGKGLFSSQPTDFQSSLKSAERNRPQEPPPHRAPVKPRPSSPGPDSADSAPVAGSAQPPLRENNLPHPSGPIQSAAEASPSSLAAQPGTASEPAALKAASGEGNSVGSIAPAAGGRLEGTALPNPSLQDGGAKGESSQPAQSAPGAEAAAKQAQLLKSAEGVSEKDPSRGLLQGLARQFGAADPAGSGPAARPGSAGIEAQEVLNGSGAKFAKGAFAFGNRGVEEQPNANIGARLSSAPSAGSGALTGGSEAGSLNAAGRIMGQAAAFVQTGGSMSRELTAGPASSSAPLPVGALTWAAAGKTGGAGLDSAGAAAGKSSPALRAEVIQQLVRQAVLVMRQGRPEIRVDLKPESLGSIKLHIATVNQQVQVKIVAQTQMVKEILEGSLSQLKLDLLNHKLDVERFDVTVAADPERSFGDSKSWGGGQRDRQPSPSGREDSREQSSPDPQHRHPLGDHSRGRVDYFV